MSRPKATRSEPDESVQFWNWVGLVAFGHLVAFVFFLVLSPIFQVRPIPPVQFISLLPAGSIVHGTPGPTQSQKTSPHLTQPSPSLAAPLPVPLTSPKQQERPPTPPLPQPVAAPTHPAEAKPVLPPSQVDLTEVERPAPVHLKPKKHHLRPVLPTPTTTPPTSSQTAPEDTTSTALTPEQIASELGQKLETSGVAQAIQIGPSGSENSQPDKFAAFYAALRDQTMNLWEEPRLVDKSAVNPVVQIHVDPDGTVPSEAVVLLSSSGDSAYDSSALAAARSLGKLTQPLPNGCPPDISITFTLTH